MIAQSPSQKNLVIPNINTEGSQYINDGSYQIQSPKHAKIFDSHYRATKANNQFAYQ
jgi:hypothetical protein